MKQAINDMLNRLNQNSSEAIVEIDEEMTHVTADIIMRTILSYTRSY